MAHHGDVQSGRPFRSPYSLGCSYGLAAIISILLWAAVIAAIIELV